MAKKDEFLDKVNADILADMIADPDTPDHMRVRMIGRLLEAKKSDNFFVKLFEERLSYGACPCCNFRTHWLVPEDELNQLGWVSHKQDPRVKRETTAEDCPQWQEACHKKRITI